MKTLIVLLLIAFAFILSARAELSNVTVTVTGWDCSLDFLDGLYVTIEADSTGGEPEQYREHYGYRVTDALGQVVAHNGFNLTFTPGTTHIISYSLLDWKVASAAMPLTVTVEDWSEFDVPLRDVASVQVTIDCPEGSDFLVSPVEMIANVYATEAGMEVWAIEGDTGVPALVVSPDVLAGDVPDTNTLLMEADGIEVYRLDTGEYQINFPVTADGIVPVRIYDTWPPTSVTKADFAIPQTSEDE